MGTMLSRLADFSLFTLSTALSQGVMMLYALILARYMGPEMYGYYAAGYSLVGFWAFVINSGIDTWYLQKGRTGFQVQDIAGKIITSKLLIFCLWAPSIIWTLSRLTNPALSTDFLLVCALDIWLDSNLTTLVNGLNIQRDYKKLSIILLSSRMGRLIGMLVLITMKVSSPAVFAIFRLLFTFTGFIMGWIALKPSIGEPLFINKSYVKELLPFLSSDIFVQVYVLADVSLLAILAGQREVGLYSPASSLISALFIIPNSLYLFFIPVFSRRFSEHNILSNRKSVLAYILASGGEGLVLSVMLAISSRWLIPLLLGRSFQETSHLLVLLSPILLFKGFQFGLATIIVAAGWQKDRLIPQAFAAFANLGANLILIPFYGARGAAIAYNLSEFLLLCGYAIVVALRYNSTKNEQ